MVKKRVLAGPLLQEVLKGVSRSFYLTLRILPRAIQPQISLAYLLARTSDTIADTELIPSAERLEALRRFRDRIASDDAVLGPIDFQIWAERHGNTFEKQLLERGQESLQALRQLSEADQAQVRRVLGIILSGQELDLIRFGGAEKNVVRALQSEAELDDYIYRVAGCVGEFWTQLCRAHLFPNAPLDDATLLKDSVRFGKGLQLVNILRDLPQDFEAGRCYIPADLLGAAGLAAQQMKHPANEPAFRKVYDRLLGSCQEHLNAGWRYTNTIPKNQVRVRLACAWPVLIGFRTVELLRRAPVLDPARRIKISRKEVRQLMVGSVLAYPFSRWWNKLAAPRSDSPET